MNGEPAGVDMHKSDKTRILPSSANNNELYVEISTITEVIKASSYFPLVYMEDQL